MTEMNACEVELFWNEPDGNYGGGVSFKPEMNAGIAVFQRLCMQFNSDSYIIEEFHRIRNHKEGILEICYDLDRIKIDNGIFIIEDHLNVMNYKKFYVKKNEALRFMIKFLKCKISKNHQKLQMTFIDVEE